MIKIRELLRLRFAAQLSVRQIARSENVSTGVVSKYINRAEALGLSWPVPEDITDHALMAMMQPPRHTPTTTHVAEPDFAQIHDELKR